MKNIYSIIKRTMIVTAVSAATTFAFSSVASAQSYDIDCKVILCLAGGFPSGCGDAKSYMLKRLKRGKSPFGFCAISNGEEYTNYSAPVRFLNRGPEAYDCPIEGTRLFVGRQDDGDGRFQSETAFCYTSSTTRRSSGGEGDIGNETIYLGQTPALRLNLQIQITIEPGTEAEYVSPLFRVNTNTGYVTQTPNT